MAEPTTTLPKKSIQRCTRCGVIVEEGRLLCNVCRYIGVNPPNIVLQPLYPIYPPYWPQYYQPVVTWQVTSGNTETITSL